jgi:hypothetical protein
MAEGPEHQLGADLQGQVAVKPLPVFSTAPSLHWSRASNQSTEGPPHYSEAGKGM